MAVEYRNGRTFNFAISDPDPDTSLPQTLKTKFIPYLATRPCCRMITSASMRSGKVRSLGAQPPPQLPIHSHNFLASGARATSHSSNNTVDSILADLRVKLEGMGMTSGTGSLPRRNASGVRQRQNTTSILNPGAAGTGMHS